MPDFRPPGNPQLAGVPLSIFLELLRQIPLCVAVYSADGTCLAASSALGDWLERPAHSLVGQGVDTIWGEFGPELLSRWQNNSKGEPEQYPSARGVRTVRVTRFEWRDGADVRGIVEWFEEGHDQRADTVGRLALGVVHDFNNALTLVQGHADLLALSVEARLGASPLLENLSKALAHACELPQQLLRLVRDEPPATERIDANTLLDSLRTLFLPRLKPNIAFRLEPAPAGAWVEGDPGQLTQVFLNLANNGLEAMPGGGELLIRVENTDTSVRIVFTDSGRGMSAEVQKRLFEPLFTTRTGGTGLGLYLSREIIHRHGGRISFRSAPGRGTTFTIELPRGEPGIVPLASTTGLVVVLEADPEIRRLTGIILARGGHSALLCANLSETKAVAESNAGRIDLFLVDVESTLTQSESELAEFLSRFPRARRLYLSTGHHATRSPDQLLGKRILIKPFGPAQLLQAVAKALAE